MNNAAANTTSDKHTIVPLAHTALIHIDDEGNEIKKVEVSSAFVHKGDSGFEERGKVSKWEKAMVKKLHPEEYKKIFGGIETVEVDHSEAESQHNDIRETIIAAENALEKLIPAVSESVFAIGAAKNSTRSEKSVVKHSEEYHLAKAVIKACHLIIICGDIYIYTGRFYEKITTKELQQEIEEFCENCSDISISDMLIERAARFIPKVKSINYKNRLHNVTQIAFVNGVLNIETGEFLPPSPNMMVFRHVEANFNPDLYGRCPCFNAYLARATKGNANLIARVWECLAFILVEKKIKNFVIFLGPKNCGKSILLKFMESLFTFSEIISLQPHDFANEFSASSVDGRKLCLCGDLPSDTVSSKAVGFIKNLTGGDSAGGRHLYSEKKILDTTGLRIVFGSNHPLAVNNNDDAFNSRLVYIVFPESVPRQEQDPDLVDKLIAEKDAIVNTAIAYIPQVLKNNGITTGETETEALLTALYGNYNISAEESIERFFDNCCELEKDSFVEINALFERYCCFMNGNSMFSKMEVFSKAFKAYVAESELPITDKNRPYGEKSPLTGKPRRLRGYTGIALTS